MIQSTYDLLLGGGAPDVDHELVVELVFDSSTSLADVKSIIEGVLPKGAFEVETAFGHAEDRYFFVRFADISIDGQEATAFRFAREMRAGTGAREANPVMRDSFYGAFAVAPHDADGRQLESALLNCSTPDNQTYPSAWTHRLVKTAAAWSTGNRGAGVRVAVIDTGRSKHAELEGVCVEDADLSGLNLVEPADLPYDTFDSSVKLPNPGHGTLVASVVASRGDVDAGTFESTGPGKVTGIAPAAEIVPIRAIRSVVDLRQSRIPRAIELAIEKRCDVIVMCLGGPTCMASVEAALRKAVSSGIVVVAAAGNCYPFVVFPAAYSRNRLCCAVAAVGYESKPWGRTARGPAVTVSAPGEDVWGATMRSADDDPTKVRASQGTTLATSTTAGVAALWVAAHGGRTALKDHADQVGTTVQDMFMRAIVNDLSPPAAWDGATDLGAGVIDVAKTLAFPLPKIGLERGASSQDQGPASSLGVLRRHVQEYGPLAAQEIDESLSEVASELIWLSYMRGAAVRAQVPGLERSRGGAPASAEARGALSDRKELERFILGSGG